MLCLPPEFVRKKVKPHLGDEEEDAFDFDDSGDPDFHDYVKGLCLETRSLFQLIWPRTYALSSKGVQDPATRAWNLFGALFYKAGGIPWKLEKPPGSLNTCYVGISFSRREEDGYMHSSLTQVSLKFSTTRVKEQFYGAAYAGQEIDNSAGISVRFCSISSRLLRFHLRMVNQPVKDTALDCIHWHYHLIGGIGTGQCHPIDSQPGSGRVCLHLQKPASVILRP